MTVIGVEDLVRLETKVWDALVDGDSGADTRMLSQDFLGVYPSGFAGREDHAGQLADGPTVAVFEITEPRTIEVSDLVVMLSYRSVFRRVSDGEVGGQEIMYVSSLWRHQDDRWLNIFSQDTPAH